MFWPLERPGLTLTLRDTRHVWVCHPSVVVWIVTVPLQEEEGEEVKADPAREEVKAKQE